MIIILILSVIGVIGFILMWEWSKNTAGGIALTMLILILCISIISVAVDQIAEDTANRLNIAYGTSYTKYDALSDKYLEEKTIADTLERD